MQRNLLLTIEYDGTGFSGWQRQPGKRTVQGTLEEAISLVCGKELHLEGTSRTDAGVHAYGQRASLKGEFGIPTDRLALAVNHRLAAGMRGKSAPGPIRVKDVCEKPMDFHARFNAKGKTYIYKIRNSADPDIFKRNYCYEIAKPLDTEAMKRAAEQIVGTHDFACFQSSGGTERETTVRTVYRLDVVENGNTVNIIVTGDGFLYNMVRIITGTLVEAGLGKMDPMALTSIIENGDRRKAGHTAPPQGLYLGEIYYEIQEVPGYDEGTSRMG